MVGGLRNAIGAAWRRRNRRARPELAELSAVVEGIVRWQKGLVTLVLLVLFVAGERFVVATDPVAGNRALLEALLSALFAGQLIVDGGRLAFAPRRAALQLALSGTGFGLWYYLLHGVLLPLVVTAGLWTPFVRAGSLARLLEAHPEAYSARRLARLRGGSGQRGLDLDARAEQEARGAARGRKRARRLMLGVALFAALWTAWALHERPEDPRAFLERFRQEHNAKRASGEPEWLSANWFATDDTFSYLGSTYEVPNDPDVPDRRLSAFFPLADGAATMVCEFRHDDEWKENRVRRFGPELLARIEAASLAFRNAWEQGTGADFDALASMDPPAPGRPSIRHGDLEPGLRPPLGPQVVEVQWQVSIVFACEDGWLRSMWAEIDGRLTLAGAQ